MTQTTNILIVGVGGQGILLASELIADAAFLNQEDVKKSEVHGMAQRGGVVSSHVRFGKQVFSPLIPVGEVDILLAFEEMEALRWLYFVKKEGMVIVNQQQMVPPIAVMKGLPYPEDPIQQIRSSIPKVLPIGARQVAKEIGNERVMNLILLGMLSTGLSFDMAVWEKAICQRVPKGTEEINIKAFHMGREKATS